MPDPKKPATSTALVAPDRLNELAEKVRSCTLAAAGGKIAETLGLAVAVKELREVVLAIVPQIRPLVGTNLGFRTDRDSSDKPPYSDAVIADCLIEAVARGLHWTGNEMNVIGGKCYTTKEGYTRLVAELPGLTDLEETPCVPRLMDGGAVVKYRATWKLDGKTQSLEREIPVRLNAGMGADGALGKARRKMLAAIHGRVTGSVQSLADVDAEDVEDQRQNGSRTAALAERAAASRPAELPAATNGEAAPVPAGDGRLFGVDEDQVAAIKG